MARNAGHDWRTQLQQLRGTVEEMERHRAEEERLKLERTREALHEHLRKDTPESLARQLQDLRKECDRAARRFYPIEALESACAKLRDFVKRLQFYKDCQGEFADLFTPVLRQAIERCQNDAAGIEQGLRRQLGQWQEVRQVMADVAFRPKAPDDDKSLIQVAKTFTETAHGMGLGLPPDFFAAEAENFHIVTCHGAVIGHVKYWPDRNVITFAVSAPIKLNFHKLVRGVLYHACRGGPLAGKARSSVRVRLGMAREVKFFTDLGFVRSETVSVSEWVYERPLD